MRTFRTAFVVAIAFVCLEVCVNLAQALREPRRRKFVVAGSLFGPDRRTKVRISVDEASFGARQAVLNQKTSLADAPHRNRAPKAR